MKTMTLTIRISEEMSVQLEKVSRQNGKSRSQIAREALQRQLRLARFDQLREQIVPFAQKQDFLTDEDVFADIS